MNAIVYEQPKQKKGYRPFFQDECLRWLVQHARPNSTVNGLQLLKRSVA